MTHARAKITCKYQILCQENDTNSKGKGYIQISDHIYEGLFEAFGIGKSFRTNL